MQSIDNYVEYLSRQLSIKKPKIYYNQAKERIDYQNNSIFLECSNERTFDLYFKLAYTIRVLWQKKENMNLIESNKDANDYACKIMEELFDVTPMS